VLSRALAILVEPEDLRLLLHDRPPLARFPCALVASSSMAE
jgi:hypothetical protein